MKIRDIITYTDMENMLVDNQAIGIFTTLFTSSDYLYNSRYSLSVGYYLEHAYNKTLSPLFINIAEKYMEINSQPFEAVIDITNAKIASIIRPKFRDKWNKTVSLLISTTYDPLKDFESSETKTSNGSDNTTYDTTLAKTGNNTDTVNYNTNIENNGNTTTTTESVRDTATSEDTYGFNSSSPVGDSFNSEAENVNNTQTTINSDSESKTGVDITNSTINASDRKTGTENKAFTGYDTIARTARNTSNADLINQELDMRAQRILFDTIFRDIDTVLTLEIYN